MGWVRCMSQTARRYGVVAVLAISIALSAGAPVSALYNTGQIQTRLPNGTTTAEVWDNQCEQYLRANASNPGELRSVINAGASYKDGVWISARGTPNVSSPILVDYGATTVPLQVNAVKFLCATLVDPDQWPTATSNVPANPNASLLANQSYRWATQSNANDRVPNRIGSLNMWPALVDTRRLIENLDVTAGPGTVSGGVGSQLTVGRDDNSRYWFSPTVNIDYNDPAGVIAEQVIVVRLYYRMIDGFHAISGPSRVEQCLHPTLPNTPVQGNGSNSVSYGQCYQYAYDIPILIRPRVIYNYELTPSSTVSSPVVTAGETVQFTHFVAKTGSTDSFDNTGWATKQFIVPPGRAMDLTQPYANMGATTNDCMNPFLSPPQTGCPASIMMAGQGAGTTTFTQASTTLETRSLTIADLPAGTRICQLAAVNPYDQTRAGHRWGRPACVTVGKKPYLTIKNGDAWAGGVFKDTNGACAVPATQKGVIGSSSSYGADTFGSFVEYGLMSLKDVSDFGSAGKVRGTRLTFRNSSTPLGNFTSATNHCLNDAMDFYGATPFSNPNTAVSNLTNLNGEFSMPGPITLGTGATMTIGAVNAQHVVVVVDGDITINNNIVFADKSYGGIQDLSSLVVISRNGNINVSQNVTRLDGFYQAKGDFNTCYEPGPTGGIGEGSGQCLNQLTVNGAVTASRIVARRIAGNGPTTHNTPAEQFIMRPDVYMGLYGESQRGGQLRTVGENELPPRY